jgi:hypothetical protein
MGECAFIENRRSDRISSDFDQFLKTVCGFKVIRYLVAFFSIDDFLILDFLPKAW